MLVIALEANVVVRSDDIVGVEDENKCQNAHDECLEENDKFLEDNFECLEHDDMSLDDDVVFLKHDDIFLDQKIIVLSIDIERRRRKDGYPKDENK